MFTVAGNERVFRQVVTLSDLRAQLADDISHGCRSRHCHLHHLFPRHLCITCEQPASNADGAHSQRN